MKEKSYAIETRNVTKCYGQEQGFECEIEILKGVDVRIEKGNFVAIMGPSGSGKTTLLDVIGCLLKPTSGEVFIEGVKINNLSDSELARIRGKEIGFVFQQYNLIQSLNALENVVMPMRILGKHKHESKQRAEKLLKLVGLGHRLNNRPSQLSGGEQQRVAIARSLANEPKIILGDEPTGNLDTKTGEIVLNLLKKLNKEEGYTIVVVTHDNSIGKYVDKIIKIKDGKIISEVNK